MVFSSTIFLFAFLPLTLALYFLMPNRAAKNVLLLVVSLVFYAWGEPVYVFLMIFSIIANWAFGLIIAKCSTRKTKRLALICAVCVNLLILGFFKYEGFLATNVNRLVGATIIPDLELPLPIGISFFTLQAVSYIVDVYRGGVNHAQKNILYLGMYISMFPQLVAGPIVRYSQIENEIDNRRETLEGFVQGMRLFIVGLGKKVLLANTAGSLADSLLVQSPETIGFLGAFSAILAYTFQIYFDFGGYSDMAIGLGKIFGFNYTRNFNYPYISKSITEFWRRWHISLGTFFRDYVYIPMGGNRVSTARWMINIAVVWGLTGIWHGAAWNFLLWGLYYGLFLMCEKLFLLKALQRTPRFIQWLYMAVVVYFGWLLFAVSGLGNLIDWVQALFGAYGFTGQLTVWEIASWQYISLLPVMVIASTPIIPYLRKFIQAKLAGATTNGIVAAPEKGNEAVPPCMLAESSELPAPQRRVAVAVNMAVDVCLFAILVISSIAVVSSSYNPFIYFQF